MDSIVRRTATVIGMVFVASVTVYFAIRLVAFAL
jgi:hypothetical protein